MWILEDFYEAWRKRRKQTMCGKLRNAVLLNLDHFGIGFSERKLIAANRDLHRVAQRRNLTDVDLHALGDAHVHDAALDRAFAMELDNLDSIADLCFTQCFPTIFLLFSILRS